MKNGKAKKGVIGRLIKTLFSFYPIMLPLVIVLIIFNAVVSSAPALFMQNIIAIVEQNWKSGSWSDVGSQIISYVIVLAVFYVLSLIAGFSYNRLMAVITQG